VPPIASAALSSSKTDASATGPPPTELTPPVPQSDDLEPVADSASEEEEEEGLLFVEAGAETGTAGAKKIPDVQYLRGIWQASLSMCRAADVDGAGSVPRAAFADILETNDTRKVRR
jgi:hypothetical protein